MLLLSSEFTLPALSGPGFSDTYICLAISPAISAASILMDRSSSFSLYSGWDIDIKTQGTDLSVPFLYLSGESITMVSTPFDPLIALTGNFAAVIGPNVVGLIEFTVGMILFSVFVWHFHEYIGKRDVFRWDAEQWARSGKLGKMAEGFMYLVKYLVAFPILVFLWFGVFAAFMFVLGNNFPVDRILLISFALVVSIRACSYYKEELSMTLAQLLPLNLLVIFLIQPDFFSFDAAQRIFDLGGFVGDILKFMAFAVAAEWFLRIAWSVKQRVAPHVHPPGDIVERFGR